MVVFFILWGFIWLFFADTGPFDDLIGSFFIVFGAAFLFNSLNEILQYKKSGKIRTRIDERVKMNALRASRRDFKYLIISISVLIALFGFKFIPEIEFVSLTSTVIGIGAIINIFSFYRYEQDKV